MNGASLLYNLLLAEAAERPELAEDYRKGIDAWSGEVEVGGERVRSWASQLELLWQTVRKVNPRAPSIRERRFIEEWIRLMLGPEGSRLAASEDARALVAARELELKRASSRLRNRSALEAWGGDSGSGRLTFRWGLVRMFVSDIRAGLPHGRGGA